MFIILTPAKFYVISRKTQTLILGKLSQDKRSDPAVADPLFADSDLLKPVDFVIGSESPARIGGDPDTPAALVGEYSRGDFFGKFLGSEDFIGAVK